MTTMLVLIVCLLCLNIADCFTPVIDLHNFPFNLSISENQCQKDVNIFQQSLENNTLWAYRLWEATQKYPLGLMEGSQYQLGDFDECIGIEHPFQTQYCLTTIKIHVNVNHTNNDPFDLVYRPFVNVYEKIDYMNDPAQVPRNKLYWGICIPRSCAAESIKKDLEIYLNKNNNRYIQHYTVELEDNDCEFKGKNRAYTFRDYTFCIIVVVLIIMVVTCTIVENKCLNETNSKKKYMKIMLCFSAKQNIKDLCKNEGGNKKFKVFYGAKFLLTIGIVMGHGLVNLMTGSLFNYINIEKKSRLLKYMPVVRGDVVVDIFFVISAILNTYSYLDQKEKKKYNMFRSVIVRYFRFVPLFAFVSFFYATFLYKIGSGPLWPKIIGSERDYCVQSWWTNILFVNNYVNVENQCIMQAWYIAIDFQVFLISIPLNYLIWKNNLFCWVLFSFVLFVSVLIPFLTVYLNNMDPFFYAFNTFYSTIRTDDDFYRYMYLPVHTRMNSYIIGMIFGYFYYRYKDTTLKLSKFLSLFIFSKLSVAAIACILTGVIFYNPYHQYNALSTALFSVLHRSAFAIVAGFILFLFSYELIPSFFLTCNCMVPLSKLCFGVYLVHFIFQQIKVASSRVPTRHSNFHWICETAEDICICLIIGFILFVIIENPFGKLIKELIPQNFFRTKNRTASKQNGIEP